MRASCRTRSSSGTSSPASQRLAQASWKCVRLTKPSRIGLAPDALVEAGERVFGGGERIFERIQGAPVRDFVQRFCEPHASSAATSMATTGTRAGAIVPPAFRSRNS